mmetsp:Transcript_17771/g.25095  ORF Transcript_17771/g.25095 Transcript_17771/m.25095 type:complete len:183 (-) Transcript_17771:1338-1886(-)
MIRNELHVPEMDACLIHPFMMRLAGMIVDECPKFLARKPTIENHSIYFPNVDLCIPLRLDGVISYVPCRSLYDGELESNDGILELTPNVHEWNLRDEEYAIQEDNMIDFGGNIKQFKQKNFVVSSVLSKAYGPMLFCTELIHAVISVARSKDGGTSLRPDELSKKWNISNEIARKLSKPQLS